MSTQHEDLLETHIVGEDTWQWVVQAKDCQALAQKHISHVGVGDAAVPYRIVRTDLSGAYVHGTVGGQGRMLLDGRWRMARAGMTSFAPAHALHAFHAVPSTRWQYCWVRYMSSSSRSVPDAMAPVLAPFDARPLKHAILGLYNEVNNGSRDMGSCSLWVDLLERYIARLADPWRRDERIVAVFDAVLEALEQPWRLDDLAGIAGISAEHLRRSCRKAFGRTPMQQVTHLRIQHAAHRLITTNDSVDQIAHEVGYENPFAFSNTFKRMTGMRPSQFRIRSTELSASG